MEFVDTHCHLNFHAYNQDLKSVIDRSIDAGVNRIMVPGLDLESSREAVDLASKYDQVYAAIGVHPEEADGFNKKQLDAFEDLLICQKVVAIGEIGLDYFHRQDNKSTQQNILRSFLDLAILHKKPVILHSRDSLQDLFQILDKILTPPEYNQICGIFHAFEGNLYDATKAGKMGFYIGAGGPITYRNALVKHDVFSKISLSNVVLETDGPFLPPQTYRGKRNEPSFIPLIAAHLAELQHCDIKEIAIITSENANTLFNWTK